MKDEGKTKEQLIRELAGLRQRVVEAELEASETLDQQAKEGLRESAERHPPTYSLRTAKERKPGDHLCQIYETEEQHRTVLTPFLRQELERGEKVLYVVDARAAKKNP